MSASRNRYGGAVTDWSAEGDLARAEERAGVEVRSLVDLSELDDARGVFDAVWPAADGSTQVAGNLMRALVHAGGYASAAYRDEQPIGAALAFVGRHRRDGVWHEHLHSHMAAVLDPFRDQHIGTALKMHQRVWALDHGIDTIVWTFDPLVRRNARVNLLKLGVDVDGFEVDFYGSMDDGINSGDPTDRLFAWWRLDAPQVFSASMGHLVPVDPIDLIVGGRDVIEIELPEDIVALRATDPVAAGQWRIAVREAFVAAFADGFRVIGVSPIGNYVLERLT
jgi:predicted GNAT superfamily acetyltransferase